MQHERSNFPKLQIHEKTLSTTEIVRGFGELSGTRKRDQSLFSLCLRLRAAYVQRVETMRLSSVSDPKKKVAGIREPTISAAIANSRDYSRRNQKASAVLKLWRRDPFVSSTEHHI